MILTTDIKSHIITNYDQVELFAKYLDIPIEEINYCLEDIGNKISNPLRNDVHPSVGFMYYDNGKLIMKDWGNDLYSGDIFNLIGILSDNDCNNSHEFINICNIILENNFINTKTRLNQIRKFNKSTTIIKFKDREFNKFDINYWNTGGIDIWHLENRDVYAAEYVWINNMNEPLFISMDVNNPTYVYYLGKINNEQIIQTYSPFGDRRFKFKTNSTTIFQAPDELYRANTLIITKSRKDKLCIECNLDYKGTTIAEVLRNILSASSFVYIGSKESNNLHKYCVTSFNSESARLSIELYNTLHNIYPNIIINTDFDKEGIINGFYHHVLYNIKTVFIGTNKLNKNSFTQKEVFRLFKRINKVNPNITLFESMFKNYIVSNIDSYTDKDLFEYFTNNGIDKGKILINKMFKDA